MKRIVSVVVAIFVFVSTCGCGQPVNPNARPTYKANVAIRHNGKPVEGANVVFNPIDSTGGVAAYGRTNSDGVAKLTTYRDADGAVEDTFKVTVVKLEQRMPDVPKELLESDPERYDELMIAAGAKAKPPAHLLPRKYASTKTTVLTAEVRPNGENSFEFELTEGLSK